MSDTYQILREKVYTRVNEEPHFRHRIRKQHSLLWFSWWEYLDFVTFSGEYTAVLYIEKLVTKTDKPVNVYTSTVAEEMSVHKQG